MPDLLDRLVLLLNEVLELPLLFDESLDVVPLPQHQLSHSVAVLGYHDALLLSEGMLFFEHQDFIHV